MQKSDFKKNQIVFLRIIPKSNAARNIHDENNPDSWVKKAIVTSVGNKYITVNDDIRFSIADNFKETTDFGGINYELHLSRQNALNAIEKQTLFFQCQKCFNHCYKNKYTLDQLQRIMAILNEKDNAENRAMAKKC